MVIPPALWYVTIVSSALRAIAQDSTTARSTVEIIVSRQFALAVPDRWTMYDQNQAVTGVAGSRGMIIFSARPLPRPGETTADPDTLHLVESGALPSFFVDRHQGKKGISCHHFSKTDAYWLGSEIKQDPLYGLGGQLFGMFVPKHDRMTVGGCEGWRYHDTPRDWTLDVVAVSDGQVLYLFSLRNKRPYYEVNRPIYEAALASLRFLAPADSAASSPP